MIYVWHHVVTLVLTITAGWALTRVRWTHRAPRLAVLLWHAVVFGVLTAAVGLLLSVGLAPYGKGVVPALGALTADLRAGVVPPALSVAHIVAVITGLALSGAVLATQAHSSRRLWRQRSRQHLLLRLVAHPDARTGAFVLDHPAAAAYCLPGPSRCVVVSTGAIRALTGPELAAVLTHEHAHARGRHHLALAPFHALRRAAPCRTVPSPAPPSAWSCSSRCALMTTRPTGTGAKRCPLPFVVFTSSATAPPRREPWLSPTTPSPCASSASNPIVAAPPLAALGRRRRRPRSRDDPRHPVRPTRIVVRRRGGVRLGRPVTAQRRRVLGRRSRSRRPVAHWNAVPVRH